MIIILERLKDNKIEYKVLLFDGTYLPKDNSLQKIANKLEDKLNELTKNNWHIYHINYNG